MKRITTFILLGVCAIGSAQTLDDVLRYSLEEQQGTARFQAMGGAFGALGGDLSALNINPAGSAVFGNSLLSFTGSNYNRDTRASFGGSLTGTDINQIELNQVGGVFVFKSNGGTDWTKLALAVNYDLVRNFDDEYRVIDSSPFGIDNYFLNYAEGVPLGPLRVQDGETVVQAYRDIGQSLGFGDQQAFLGFQAGFIDPVDPDDDNNTSYFSNADYGTVNQDYLQSTRGYNSKFTLNFAGEYHEELYLGASLNFHSVLYERVTYLDESRYDAASPIQSATFDSFLRTEGEGFSMSIGAIAKLNEFIRIGGSYQSPTWYRLFDDFAQQANTDFADKNPAITDIDFGVVNLFERYTVKTPAKFTGSAALIFGQEGLISFDYDYQDFGTAQLRPTSDPNFADENALIDTELGGVSTIRVGGEYRMEQLSLRGGYRWQQTPFADNNFWGDQETYSAGIGYSWGPNRLDLSYSRTEQEVDDVLYDGAIANARLDRSNSFVALSYTIQF